jgi:hypothetical protein
VKGTLESFVSRHQFSKRLQPREASLDSGPGGVPSGIEPIGSSSLPGCSVSWVDRDPGPNPAATVARPDHPGTVRRIGENFPRTGYWPASWARNSICGERRAIDRSIMDIYRHDAAGDRAAVPFD